MARPDILLWLRRRRERAARAEADASNLIRELGKDAYTKARLMQYRASSGGERRHWRAVALAVAAKTGRRVGLDVATRMSADADPGERSATGALGRNSQPVDPIEELRRLIGNGGKPP